MKKRLKKITSLPKRIFISSSKNVEVKTGTAPGSLIFVGTQKVEEPYAEVIAYNVDEIEKHEKVIIEDIPNLLEDKTKTCWINVVGLHQVDFIERVGKVVNLPVLQQEDVLNTDHRPKYEEVEQQIFFVMKMLQQDYDTKHVEAEQLSIILGDNYLVTFQEGEKDVFNPLRNRLFRPTTQIRNRKNDYLAFAIIDAVIDHYIEIIAMISESINILEDELLSEVKSEHLEHINAYRRELNSLRKVIRPLREVSTQYYKTSSELIREDTRPFLKDLEDHIIQIIDTMENYREMLKDQLDLYQNIMNSRLNDALRTLTVFSVVFIPLTFLAGIYGTNFAHFPELQYKYAYPIFWGVMIFIAAIMIAYFKRKGWL